MNAPNQQHEHVHEQEFWVSSGHLLSERTEDGYMAVTDAFIKAFYARPEVLPPEEACPAERALHQRLMIAPADAVSADDIKAMLDPDARENWTLLMAFRDRLLAKGTLEAAYLSLVKEGMGKTPPLFLNQIVHAILRNAFDDEEDAFVLRAAEMFFRPQRLTVHEGALLLADEETVDGAKVDHHASPLVAMFGEQAVKGLDVLLGDNAEGYKARSDAFDMVLDFSIDKPARAALATAMQRFIQHLTGITTRIRPIARAKDDAWVWFIGLDQEGTRFGNRLWKGDALSEADAARVVALYEMRFEDESRLKDGIAGKPVYLLLGMGEDRIIRLKPQNLIAGLPLKEAQS